MIFFLVFISTAAVLFYEFYWKRRNLPPGPTPLPLLGNLVSVVKCSPGYECFREWRKEYGPVYTYWLGPQPMVVVADYQTMKESIIKDGDKFADRFVLHTLRDFGMGKNLMEERVMLEVDFLIDRMRSLKTDLNMQSEFDTAVGSIINNILFGYRFDESKQHEFKLIKGHLRTLRWTFGEPKMHEELDRVIGSDRMITMADKNDLPYVNAVVNEAQRVANLLPQNLQRKLLEDTVIGGHPIKAGTVVMPQISTVLYDERVFPDPYTFKPERFINSDGSLKKYDELVPFSVGKRQCVGEGLAKVELFLFVANLFQRFKFSAKQTPSMVKNRGQVVTAKIIYAM
ncbi:unnamed protein product, partial [Mesorhabditis spiculigera]